MPYNRSDFISGVEKELGKPLTRSQKARIDDIAAELGSPQSAAQVLQRENEKHHVLGRRIFAALSVALAIGLAVALAVSRNESSGEEGWYLLVVAPDVPAVEQASPFGSDKAKCEEFAAKFTKYARTNIKSSCVSGKQLEQLERERRAASKANF